MNIYKKWHYQCVAKDMVDTLRTYHYDAHYAENLEEARTLTLSMIPAGASVALGGSETLSAMNILETLRSDTYRLFDRYQNLPHEEIVEIMRQSLLADVLLTGTNAITRNGELVNLDCSGNRVAGMIFGPKKVIIVAGANKVVDTLDDAMKRVKQIAPLNAKRIQHKTPCAETGRCVDCHIQQRLCNYLSVMYHGMKFEGRLTVILIAEDIGF